MKKFCVIFTTIYRPELNFTTKIGFLIDLNTKDMEIFGIANKETVLGVNLFENPNLPLHIIEALRRKEAITFRIKYPLSTIKNYYSSKKNGLLEIYTTATELYDSREI